MIVIIVITMEHKANMTCQYTTVHFITHHSSLIPFLLLLSPPAPAPITLCLPLSLPPSPSFTLFTAALFAPRLLLHCTVLSSHPRRCFSSSPLCSFFSAGHEQVRKTFFKSCFIRYGFLYLFATIKWLEWLGLRHGPQRFTNLDVFFWYFQDYMETKHYCQFQFY